MRGENNKQMVLKTEHIQDNVSDNGSDEESPKRANILPLNSSVIQRIRLNINTRLASGEDNPESIETSEDSPKDSSLGETNETVLQKTMRQKLANVLQSDPQISDEKWQNSIQSESTDESVTELTEVTEPDFDLSSFEEQWSILYSHYQLLNQTVKKSSKNKTICLDSDLWNSFGFKINSMQEMFSPLDQTNRSVPKRSTQESIEYNKKLKHYI